MQKKLSLIVFLLSLLSQAQSLSITIDKLPVAQRNFLYSQAKQHHGLIEDDSESFLVDIPLYIDYKPLLHGLDERYEKTLEDVLYLQILGGSFIVGLWLLPENISKWDHSKIQEKSLYKSWSDNISSGPVIDQDEWYINYIGHSLSGAYFYTLARNNDLTIGESAAFNFLMSTVYWEYGVEAIFEVPSTQDLLITPILGSFLGEGFYQIQQNIYENNGEVLGSTRLGNFFLILLNPEGSLADFLRTEKENVNIKLITFYNFYVEQEESFDFMRYREPFWIESYFGFEITVRF